VEKLLRRIVGLQPRRSLQLGDERMKRAVGMVGRALVTQARVRLAGDALGDGRHKAGLADPGLARDQHDLPFARRGEALALQQEIELVLRPTRGVRPPTRTASKRLSRSETPSTVHAATNSALPLASRRPRSRRQNRPPSKRRVESAMT